MRIPLVETIPARILAPLLLAHAALLGVGANYLLQTGLVRELVEVQQQSRVTEILNREQTRLETPTMFSHPLEMQRHVASLGLHSGFTHALLVDRDNRIEAAMLRTRIGLALVDATEHEPPLVRAALLEAASRVAKGITTSVARDGKALVAHVAVVPGRRLIVRVDLEPVLSARMAMLRAAMLREAGLLLALAAVLAFLLNLLWFRRTARLTSTVRELGEGHLDARTGLTGRDELSRIGVAIDHMAADLQLRQHGLERLSALIEHSPVAAIECLFEPGWPVVFASGNVGQWGYDAQELMFRHAHVAEFIHHEDLHEVGNAVERICDDCADYVHEFRIRDTQGGWHWVSARSWAKRGANGDAAALQAVLIDITARRQAEEAMRRQSDLLRQFYELPFIGMSVASLKTGRWLQINDRLCELLAYPRDELMQKTSLDVTFPDDRRGNLANFERLRRGEISGFRQEKRFVRKDGAIVHAIVDVRAVPHDGGEVDLVVATVEDITERKLNEIALHTLNTTLESRVAERTAQLESANRELESFSYAVSHDLKAPLRGIDGYSQILLEEYGTQFDDDGRRLLANIRRGVAQMHELIEDLLAYSRIERRPFDARRVDVAAVVGATTEAFAREIADSGAVVTTDLRVPELSVDRHGLALVLRNLVGNALKFSRSASPPRIRIGAEADDGRVRLQVCDNGIGFDMKYHSRIFEIFQRLHRAEDYPGTGIGLALVRKAVERMGGSVRAESAPGRGATFIVELPR